MNAQTLFETLKKLQEPKGYFFNLDMGMTMPLLESLIINKDLLGYMACPCRLASGDREQDTDIICPCVYREPDVMEFGSCFCGLYVSKEWNDGKIKQEYVPDRRPAEKVLEGLLLNAK